MSAYLIANIELHDAERYQDYVEHVPTLIENRGRSSARFLSRSALRAVQAPAPSDFRYQSDPRGRLRMTMF